MHRDPQLVEAGKLESFALRGSCKAAESTVQILCA